MDQRLAELMVRANQAHETGRLADSERFCREIIEADPNNLPALVLLGVVASKSGNLEKAVPFFQRAIAVEPGCAPAHQWLSMTQRRLGHHQEALTGALESIRLEPRDGIGLLHLGLCQLEVGQFPAAEVTLRKAQSIAPNLPGIYAALGLVFRRLNRNGEAIAVLRQSLKMDPSNPMTLTALRETLMESDDPLGAAQVAKKLADLQPQSAEANLWVARSLMDALKSTEAEPYVERAMKLEPQGATAHLLMGSVMQVKGNLGEAERNFQRAIQIQPDQGSAYLGLVSNRKMTELDRPLVNQMLQLARGSAMALLHRSQLHYALGKALEDLGEFEESMKQYDEANRLSYEMKFGTRSFDRRAFAKYYDGLIHDFTAKYFAKPKEVVSKTETPIFVLGMIRSGTTLTEQILSCHPDVGAAGELRAWLEFSGQIPMNPDGPDLFTLQRFASRYEKLLEEMAPGRARVVDKMPTNYQAIGLIHTAMPNAKIVHVRRNPLDTCLSIYATPNSTRIGWANDKANIVFAYEQYERLMDHWRKELPAGVMTEVQYEDLVSDPEPTTRALIAACGLEWSDACLRPEKNERSVATPSVWQVRQPVYKTSMGRGQKFGPWLGAFAKLNRP